MKHFVCFLFFLVTVALCIHPVLAHPGSTDANGGHYNRSTGEYHFHHGYPAHQHINGECPYAFDDQTDHSNSSGSNSGSSGSSGNISVPNIEYSPSSVPPPASQKSSPVEDVETSAEKDSSQPIWFPIVFAVFLLFVLFRRWLKHANDAEPTSGVPARVSPAPQAMYSAPTPPAHPSSDQASRDAVYRQLFAGKRNPYTKSPILTEADFRQYIRQYVSLHGHYPQLFKSSPSKDARNDNAFSEYAWYKSFSSLEDCQPMPSYEDFRDLECDIDDLP